MAESFCFCVVRCFSLSPFLSGGLSFVVASTVPQSRTGLVMAAVNLCSSWIWGSCRPSHKVRKCLDPVLDCEAVFALLLPSVPVWPQLLRAGQLPFFQPSFTNEGASLQSLDSARESGSNFCSMCNTLAPTTPMSPGFGPTHHFASQFSFQSTEKFILFLFLFLFFSLFRSY